MILIQNKELSLQEQTFKLAYSFASKYQKYTQFFDSFEDYVMSLTCHLLEKLDKYDNNVASFGTYAYTVFTNYVKREIMIQNYQKRHAKIISLDTMIDSNDDSKDKVPLYNLIDVEDETFEKEDGKKLVKQEEMIKRFYEAIFVNQYNGSKYSTVLGQYEFSKESKLFALSTSSMMSNFAELS